jgi:hypothetical protein
MLFTKQKQGEWNHKLEKRNFKLHGFRFIFCTFPILFGVFLLLSSLRFIWVCSFFWCFCIGWGLGGFKGDFWEGKFGRFLSRCLGELSGKFQGFWEVWSGFVSFLWSRSVVQMIWGSFVGKFSEVLIFRQFSLGFENETYSTSTVQWKR